MSTTAADWLDRARRFLLTDLWQLDLSPRTWTSSFARLLQFAVMIGESFVRDQLLLRASALTYVMALSLIPLFAVGLNLVHALGMGEGLAELAVHNLFAGSAEVKTQFLRLVEGVNVQGLGSLGAVTLIVTTVLTLRHVELTLNDIWGVQRSRSWMRRFTDYLAVMIVAPVSTGFAISMAATLQAEPLVQELLRIPVVAEVESAGMRSAPVFFFFFGVSFVYWFFPNTPVRIGSAALGGAVAAILFSGAQILYVDFSVGAAKYSALFGGFVGVPLLLIWMYISWAIVLFGAELSFAHQNLAHYRREARGDPPGAAERESLGLKIALRIAQAFRDRSGAVAAEALADEMDVSVRATRDLLHRLEKSGIVAESSADERDALYQLGAPADLIRVSDVLSAIRGSRREPGSGAADAQTAVVLAQLDQVFEDAVGQRTLASLLENVGPAHREA